VQKLHLSIDESAKNALLYIGRCKYAKSERIKERKKLNSETGC
jgi:hypothetical protein